MDCPVDRGGCGQTLQWDDGAFCKTCMRKAEIQIECNHEWQWTGVGWKCIICNKFDLNHPCYHKEQK
jgi:hypothetical protein